MYDQIEVELFYTFDNSQLRVIAFFAVFDGPENGSFELQDRAHYFEIIYENTTVTKLIEDLDSEFFSEIEKDCLNDAKKQCEESYKDRVIYLPKGNL